MTIDFHSHILPAVDHGSKNLEQSQKQLMLMKNIGIDMAVATSHFYPHVHTVEDFANRVDVAMGALCDAVSLSERPVLLRGAEVLVCEGMERMDGLEQLCIEGTNCLLLEMPMVEWGTDLLKTAERLLCTDRTVVLAHIDRYRDRLSQVKTLLDMGALAQLNVSAFDGMFSKKRWQPYLESGAVVAFGSDLHGENQKALKKLTGLQKKLGNAFDEIAQRTQSLVEHAKRY